jgi:predicted nucleic acid-binding protein
VIVVSDTSPLNYLVLIDAVDVLPVIFEWVYVPPSVIVELSSQKTPDTVQQWAASPPEWLQVVAPTTRLPSTARLGDGEADALSFDQKTPADKHASTARTDSSGSRAGYGSQARLESAGRKTLRSWHTGLTAFAAF